MRHVTSNKLNFKYMKKILFTLMLALGVTTMFAQKLPEIPIENMPPYKIGATAGFNASTFSASDYGFRAAFNVGVDFMVDASALIPNTYARTGLLLQMKGASFKWDDVIKHRSPEAQIDYNKLNNDGSACAFYLEIPINYGYVYGYDQDWAFLGETGPYIAIGLGGSISNPNPNTDSYNFYNQKISYGGKEILSGANRFDLGWAFAVGAMYQSKHQLKIGYQFGFLNVSDEFLQNRNLMIGYSYFFE